MIVRRAIVHQMLAQALTSLANQTLQDFEVIIMNDGSQDVTNVLERLTPYLEYPATVASGFSGRAAALNAGIAARVGITWRIWMTMTSSPRLTWRCWRCALQRTGWRRVRERK